MKDLKKDSYSSAVGISIIKRGAKGQFCIKIGYGDEQSLSGKIFIYLDNGKVITLIDRNNEWVVNGDRFGLYELTTTEIGNLKHSNIRAVRYTTYTKFAHNNYQTSEVYNKEREDYGYTTKRVDFPSLIKAL